MREDVSLLSLKKINGNASVKGISFSTVTKTTENMERMIKTDRKIRRKVQSILSRLS